MRWVSDDGEVEVSGRAHDLAVHVKSQRLQLRLFKRGHGGIGRRQDGDDVDVVVAIKDGGELLVAHSWVRPWAAGTEADPRSGSREWRCARVIEERETR